MSPQTGELPPSTLLTSEQQQEQQEQKQQQQQQQEQQEKHQEEKENSNNNKKKKKKKHEQFPGCEVVQLRNFGDESARVLEPYFTPHLSCLAILVGGLYLFDQTHNEKVAGGFWQFLRVFCAVHFFSVVINISDQLRFYCWFMKIRTKESKRRGFSTFGYPLFGILPVPIIPPKLLYACAVAYMISLATCAVRPSQQAAWSALFFAFFYHGSLWAERTSSYHREATLMTALIYASLCPPEDEKQNTLTFSLFRLHVTSIYFMSIIQKTYCSWKRGAAWFHYSPHYFMWRSIWSKPYNPRTQKFFFLNRWLMSLGGIASLVFEGAPFVMLCLLPEASARLPLLAIGFKVLAFHFGVLMLQGIDYCSFFAPALLSFVAVSPAASVGGGKDTSVGHKVLQAYLQVWERYNNNNGGGLASSFNFNEPETIFLLLSLFFFAFQMFYCFCGLENFNINIPPFMSAPMFVTVGVLNDHEGAPPMYLLTEENRCPLKVERLEWMNPAATYDSAMSFPKEDVCKIPFPFVAFGWFDPASLDDVPSVIRSWFDLKFPAGFFLFSNVKLSDELKEKMKFFVQEMHGCDAVKSGGESSKALSDPYNNLEAVYKHFADIRNGFHHAVKKQIKNTNCS